MINKQQLWSSIQSQLAQAGIGGNFGNKEVADRLNETINEFSEEYHKERLALLGVSPRYFRVYSFCGGQRESSWIIKGKNYTDAVCKFRMKNKYYMNRDIVLECEINEG